MNKINKKKYINALLYFIENCNNKFLGKTKLNKLFYYLDFIYYRDHKVSVTRDIYICEQFGPVPKMIDLIKSESIKLNLIKTEIIDDKICKEKYHLLKNPNLNCFNSAEKILLNKICNHFKSYSTDKIVDQTHFEAPWFYSKLYEQIDYNYANDIDIIS